MIMDLLVHCNNLVYFVVNIGMVLVTLGLCLNEPSVFASRGLWWSRRGSHEGDTIQLISWCFTVRHCCPNPRSW